MVRVKQTSLALRGTYTQVSTTSSKLMGGVKGEARPNVISQLSLQSEASTNSSERAERRLTHTSSLPQSLSDPRSEQRESFNSRRSFQSQTSSNVSAHLSFGSVCQVQGIQGCNTRCLKVVQAHKGHISALVVSQGLLYTTSSSSNTIHVWRIPEADEVHKFGRGEGIVKFLLALDARRIISAHQDRKIRVWERVESPECHKHSATLPTMMNQVLTFVCSGCIQVRRHRHSLWIQHSDAISVLAKCSLKQVLYSGSWDKSFKVWRLSDFKCLESVEAHADAVNALVVSSAGYVYTGSADSKIKVWEYTFTSKKQKHVLVATLEGHRSAVNTLALSSDEMLLYSGSSDRKILLWEREDSAGHMSLLGALRGHRQSVLSLGVSDDIVCSGSADKTIRVWRRGVNNVHSCLALLQGHLGPVKIVSVFPGNAYRNVDDETGGKTYVVYSGSSDSDIRIWLVWPDELMTELDAPS